MPLEVRAIHRLVADPHNPWAWYEAAKAAQATTLGQLADAFGMAFMQDHLVAAASGLALRNDLYADAMLCEHPELTLDMAPEPAREPRSGPPAAPPRTRQPSPGHPRRKTIQ